MLFPHDIERKLGFEKIRDLLKSQCSGERGRRNVDKIRFSSNPDLIRKLTNQTMEYKEMVQAAEHLPSLNYPEIDTLLQKLRIEGIFLETEEISNIYKSLKIQSSWSDFLKTKSAEYNEIPSLAKHLHKYPVLLSSMERCIDEKGQIKESASSELKRINSEISQKERTARKTLDRVMRDTQKSDMSPEDSSLTIRNGRLVIPIKSAHKKSVRGFIHDASATGSIIFIEPAEVLEINNDLNELSYAKKREVIRILTDLTKEISVHREDIAAGDRFLGVIDLIKAKALFSIQFVAHLPILKKQGGIALDGAMNPILKRALQKQNKEIVPLNIKLDRQKRILIISGPNAGGKSVCLQTVGLLQYMYQCGFPIPVLETSSITIFKNLFIDIGDEQSIEDDLSTYSSHLKSMDFLLKNANQSTLFLIDEFGAGTDPQFGGAIAEAILEQLEKSNSMGIITTHYNNLKKMADSHNGLINGRMRFDVKKLEPLYQLEIGKPGSSFALEIASKIGLSKQLIQSAKNKVGTDAVALDRLLTELEKEKKYFEEQSKHFENQTKVLDNTIKNYKDLQSILEENKKVVLNNAKIEAKNLLAETNQRIENLIRNIKENKAEKVTTKKHREEVRSFEKSIKIEKVKKKDKEIKIIKGSIGLGDAVRIKGQEAVGEVVHVGKKDLDVMFGNLKSKVKINRLEKISRSNLGKTEQLPPSSIRGIDINKRRSLFSTNLDVRGKRAEEALNILSAYLDDAILFGASNVRIIHGKGDGILREVLREEMKGYKEISSWRDEHADRGGAGITVVEFH